MKYKTIVLFCLICLVFVGFGIKPKLVAAAGNTYYVATTGADNNPGTLAKPWLTIQHAFDTAVAGDTVNIVAGNYNTTDLHAINSGSAGNYITFQNYAGGTVNITIQSSVWDGFFTNAKDYLRIIGISFIGGGSNTHYGLNIEGSDYITIQNCTVTNTKSSGIYSRNSTYVTVDGCALNNVCTGGEEECISFAATSNFEIKNCIVRDPGSTQRIGIDIKEGCHDGSVHHNEVYNLSGWYTDGIYIDARGDSYNIDIYNNIVHDIPYGYGISVGDETATTSPSDIYNINIYNNIVYNCKLSGFCLYSRGQETYTNIFFVNNTLYSNASSVYNPEIWASLNPTYTNNVIIRNNIIYSTINNAAPIYDPNDAYDGGKLLVDHNLFYNAGGSFYTDGDNIFGDSSIQANPLFVTAGSDFHIQSISPAKDAGSATRAPATDYIGTSRPQGAGVDIGAYEQLGSTSLAITTSSLPNGTVGTAYSQNLTAAGGTIPYTWTIASGTLPAGLSLSTSGVISGTPTTAGGPTSITFKVTDGVSAIATKSLTISINTILSIITSSLPNGTVGVSYSQALAATGGTGSYTWTISSGTLPVGLSLSSGGVISGTPTAAGGPTSITFRVTDSASSIATKTLTITVVYAVWDVNMDGVVNILDMINISQHWGESGTAGWIRADVNSDGVINSLDMIVIGQHWTG